MANGIYDFEDIKPQLSKEQIESMEHFIFMAKELEEPQKVKIGQFGATFIIWPSGKLQIFERIRSV